MARQLFASKQGGFFEFKPMYVSAIPIPQVANDQRAVIEPLVDATIQGISRPEFERLLNGLVYELFFPEDLHAANIHLFDACNAAGVQSGMDAQAIAVTVFRNNHPINALLYELQTLPVVCLIEGKA